MHTNRKWCENSQKIITKLKRVNYNLIQCTSHLTVLFCWFLQNKLIYQYELPENQYTSSSSFLEFVVDVRNNCDVCPFIYAADAASSAIIVLDGENSVSWRVQDKSMFPDPDNAEIAVNG